jgi:invasion protein IalB
MSTYKKILFLAAGLAIIGVSFFYSKFNMVEAAFKEGQKFDDWAVACIKDKDNKKKQICFLTQQVTSTNKDNKTEVLAVYQIGYFKDKTLSMVQLLPLGTNLVLGTSIISSDKLIAPGKYTTCTGANCYAVAEISDQDLNSILSSNTNSLGYMNAEGKQINLPISTKGLKEGLEALKQ